MLIKDKTETLIGYVVEIKEDKVKVHFEGKMSSEYDRVFTEEEFGNVVRLSKFEYDTNNVHAGLINLGNTCYMNSVVQCLLTTPIFENFLVKSLYKDLVHQHKQPSEYPVIRELS